MSGLSIAVAGVLTAVLCPIFANLIKRYIKRPACCPVRAAGRSFVFDCKKNPTLRQSKTQRGNGDS